MTSITNESWFYRGRFATGFNKKVETAGRLCRMLDPSAHPFSFRFLEPQPTDPA